MTRTCVLVAEPLAIFRAGVAAMLVREGEFDVVEAADLGEVESMLAAGRVDVALVDIDLPPAGGVEAVALLRRHGVRVVVWTIDPTEEHVLAAITAGAAGFLHKEISPSGLVRSLRGVTRGEAPLARDLATLMIDAIHRLEERSAALRQAAVLSPRELEVLDRIARGHRNRQIAQALSISEFTVKRHVQNILAKLGLPTRRAAGAFYLAAYDRGVDGEERRPA